MRFRRGITSQSNVGFMSEVIIFGKKFPGTIFALACGKTREEAETRATQIVDALSGVRK